MACSTERRSGFTLLEIMLTLVIVGVPVIMMLLIRERSTRQSMEAHNLNVARTLARELLTELEFHDLDRLDGDFDGFPGFSYHIEVEEVDLVTGQGEQDAEDGSHSTDSGYTPPDAVGPPEQEDEEHEGDYPARRVRLVLRYPDLRERDSTEPLELRIQTVLPPLPRRGDDGRSSGSSFPFGG